MNVEALEQAMIDLQTRYAYQEDLLNSLNKVVAEQALRIDFLQQQLRDMRDSLAQVQDAAQRDLADVPPPHY